MKSILISGFDAFGAIEDNPSAALAMSLHDQNIAGIKVTSLILPTSRKNAPKILLSALDNLNPILVLAIGLSIKRENISLERVALNFDDFSIPDNCGDQPRESPIIADAPAAYFGHLPFKHLKETLGGQGIKVDISLSAGSYVCNHVYFQLMHEISIRKASTLAGFIHIPPLNSSPHNFSLQSLEEVIRTIITASLSQTFTQSCKA